MLPEKQYQQIRDELKNCKNPLFFYDDDPDGLCSFLLLYRYIKEGRGIAVKTHPTLDARSAPKIVECNADKVFVLDVAHLEQDFIDASPVPVIWIDHHGPFDRHNVKYFNPRLIKKDANFPTTYLCYKVTQQDLWIAMVGCIADMHLPDFFHAFSEQYPAMLNSQKDVQDIYFNSDVGKLIKTFSFCLKGRTDDVKKNLSALTKINEPEEILNQTTAAGKFIFKQYAKTNKMYESLLNDALSYPSDKKMIVYSYTDEKMSFTGDLANELLYKFPKKIILIGRRKGDEVRMSIRSKGIMIPLLLEKALIGLEGYGGGHEYACGANVKAHDFSEFVERFEKLL